MDNRKAYRDWLWGRLALLLPSWLFALAANLWLARVESCPLWVRFACLPLASLFLVLIGYFLIQTLRCAGAHRRGAAGDARLLRRELRPCAGVVVSALVLLAGLVLIPRIFLREASPALVRTLHSRSGVREFSPARLKTGPSRPTSVLGGEEEEPSGVEAEAFRESAENPPRLPDSGAPVLARGPRGNGPASLEGVPEIEPGSYREPVELELSESEAPRSLVSSAPVLPPETPTASTFQDNEERPLPERPNFSDPAFRPDEGSQASGTLDRPLPDEFDSEGQLGIELRVDVLLLMGDSLGRIPAIDANLNFPLGRDDSFEMELLGVRFPDVDLESRPEHSLTPNWDHATFCYLRRLTGYTRHAGFDLAVSGGANADFLGPIKGVDTSGLRPILTPYVGADAAFWQEGTLGLLLHVGESIPVSFHSASLGLTDLSAEVRSDLNSWFSFHAGYRILFIRSNGNAATADPTKDRSLVKNLGGPTLGVDLRF